MKEVLSNKKILKRIVYTFLLLAVYRIGTSITVPGINRINLTMLSGNSVFSLMNMLGGGALERMSIFALGVGPYITAGIIVELLSMDVIPSLSELRKDGLKGRQKIEKITGYLGFVLAIIQSVSITYGFDKQYGIMTSNKISDYLFIAVVLTAGYHILLWIGERISAVGVGNGISLLIFAGIVSNIPSSFVQTWSILVTGTDAGSRFNGILIFAVSVLLYLAIIVGVVIMQLAVRKIPIQYSANIGTANNLNYLPLKVNSASVLPVIFASSVITAPQIILSFINTKAYNTVSSLLSLQKPFGLVLYGVLIVLFTYFYVNLQMDPKEISKTLASQQAYIPGIRPGTETTAYIKKVLARINFFGASGLLIIAMLPHILPALTPIPSSMAIGGTGIIIVVGVAIETIDQMIAAAQTKTYKNYTSSGLFQH